LAGFGLCAIDGCDFPLSFSIFIFFKKIQTALKASI
jgi:hypothetical protein